MCPAVDKAMYGTFRLYENTQDNTRKIGDHSGNKQTKKGILENTILSLVCFLLLKNHLYIIMYADMHISEDNFVELVLFFHLYNGSRV